MSQPVVFTPISGTTPAAPTAPATPVQTVQPTTSAPTTSAASAKLTPLVTALKTNDLVTAQSLLTSLTLSGADLINVAQSVSTNAASLNTVLADARVGTPEITSLVYTAVRTRNDPLLATLVQNPKISMLKSTAVLNNAFKNRPYDMAKMLATK